MELISKDEAIKQIEEAFDIGDCNCDRFALRGILKSLPTVEERKEGKWLDNKWLGEKCSICSWELHYINFGQFKYCPNCGARMKGENNGNIHT